MANLQVSMSRWMMFLVVAPVLFIVLTALTPLAGWSEPRNILRNSGFDENPDAKGLPRDWWLWEQNPGQVECALDGSVRHSDGKSFRMKAAKDAHAVLVAPMIPVVEGEKFEVSVWVKTENLTSKASGGQVIFNVAFVRADGHFLFFTKLGKMVAGGDWVKLTGETTVPGEVSQMTFELGLKDASGTVWFDDGSIISKSLYSVRPSSGSSELPPGDSNWSIDVMNRSGESRGAVVNVLIGERTFSRDVELSGSGLQQVDIPIKTNGSGSRNVKISLADKASGQVLVESSRRMSVPEAVELEPLVPTHFCKEDGKPALEARIWNHLSQDQVSEATLTLTNAAGAVLDSRTVRPVKSGWQDVGLSSDKAGLGDYRVEVKLIARDGKTYSAVQPWHVIRRSQAKVTFNSAGFPVADGRPVFPLGTFNSGRYELMKKTGFTVTHAWNRMKLPAEGGRINNQLAKDYLDEVEKAGMKAIGFLHVAYMERNEWDELTRRVRMFRNHPALLAWDQEEGVARAEVKMPAMERLAGIVRKEDPNHPFVLADSYDEITKVDRSRFFREDLMDGGMWWFYPIPLKAGGKTAALEGRDDNDGSMLNPPSFLVSTKKPLWVGLQAYKAEVPGSRLPTDAEYRCMAYLAVVHGAKGLLYYMGGSAGSIEGVKDKSRPWSYLHELVPELHAMAPVFMAPTVRDVVRVDPPKAGVDTLLKRVGGDYTLIAVNRGDKELSVTLSSSAFGSQEINTLFERRGLHSMGGKLPDRFKPYAVHIYRWKAAK